MAAANMEAKVGLNKKEQKLIAQWLGWKNVELNLLYKASRDGCNGQAFHQRCNNQGSTITVLYNTTGHVFGFYVSTPWTSNNNWAVDSALFAFQLKTANKATPLRINAYALGYTAIHTNGNLGPNIGSNQGYYDIQCFTGATNFVVNGTENTVTPTGFAIQTNQASPYTGLQWNGRQPNDFHGGNTKFLDIEVYSVKESLVKDLQEESWRKFPYAWSPKTRDAIKTEVVTYRPDEAVNVPKAQLLLAGPVGAGKSSFFNTIKSLFKGYVTTYAPAGSTTHSLTMKYRTYDIHKGKGGDALNIKLCDSMGMEEEGGILTNDFLYILDGNIPNRYQFNPNAGITPETPGFKKTPGLRDRIHLVAIVIDANTVSVMPQELKDKIKNLRSMAVSRHMPHVILLTKIDQLCPHVSRDVSTVFHSEEVQDVVDTVSDMFGIPRSNILPIKNYENEIELDVPVDILTLVALRSMLRLADNYFEEQLDLLVDDE